MNFISNPVFEALSTFDAHLGSGSDKVKFFDEQVSPFVGIEDGFEKGFNELHDLLPAGRRILYATSEKISIPKGWDLAVLIPGLQFILKTKSQIFKDSNPVLLGKAQVDEMIALTTLTKPGPFTQRTIEFGHYYGFFENGSLAAMTGQRLHLPCLTEISAVCTHPNHLGKGLAARLMTHQINLIQQQGQTPFLHVRADNERAIALYQRLGFKVSGEMNFYFMKKAK